MFYALLLCYVRSSRVIQYIYVPSASWFRCWMACGVPKRGIGCRPVSIAAAVVPELAVSAACDTSDALPDLRPPDWRSCPGPGPPRTGPRGRPDRRPQPGQHPRRQVRGKHFGRGVLRGSQLALSCWPPSSSARGWGSPVSAARAVATSVSVARTYVDVAVPVSPAPSVCPAYAWATANPKLRRPRSGWCGGASAC